jgi:predicted  nucleic acid-binding Zn-ribbon protein
MAECIEKWRTGVKEEVTLMIHLQELDTEIVALKREKIEIPIRIAELNDELSRLTESLAHEQERSGILEKEKRSKETGLKEEEDRLVNSEKKLSEVKTNKEYQAAQKEIEEHRIRNSLLEEQILLAMDQLDSLKTDIVQKEEELTRTTGVIKTDIDTYTARALVIEDQVTQKEGVRAKLVRGLGTSYLSTYERLMRTFHDEPVLVKVRKGVCTGCFINLPPQFFNELLRDRDIKTCPNCARLIYLEEEPEKDSINGVPA